MRISVTGHMDLSAASTDLVRAAIAERLKETQNSESAITGISCLARGADSIFAEAVLENGGNLEVVLPSPHYRAKKVKEDHAPLFDKLISRASQVRTLPHEEVDKEAYEAANNILVGECDRLFAVWDGQASGRSGTATVVQAAQARDIPVTVIWPDGASRDSG